MKSLSRTFNPRVLAYVFVIATLSAIWLGHSRTTASTTILNQKNYPVEHYEWVENGAPNKQIAEPFDAEVKDLAVSFRMRLLAFSRYPNVFATAPLNSGLRMEIAGPTASGLVVARGGSGGISGLPLPFSWEIGKWYAVSIELSQNKTLTVSIDGRPVASAQDQGYSPLISEITVGGGFDSQRVFHGEIKDFNLQMQSYAYSGGMSSALVVGLALSVLLALCMLVLLIRGQIDTQEKIDLIKLIVLCGFVCSVFYHYVLTAYLGKAYPANTFLCIPSQFFGDFRVLYDANVQRNPYLNTHIPSGQYPFLNLLFYIFSKIGYFNAATLYFLFTLGPLCWILWCLPNQDNRFNRFATMVILGLMTYPVLFTLDRGNTEGIVFTLLLMFLWFYQKGRHDVSACFLALAIAMKGFPAIFLVLFLADRRWKALTIAMGTAFLLTIGALVIFRGGFINNLTYITGGNNFSNIYFDGFLGANNIVQRSASLYTGFKIAFIQMGRIGTINMKLFLHNYIYAVSIIGIILSSLIAFRERALWRRVTALASLMILLPQLSADYKLIHILLPCILFIREGLRQVSDWAYALLFGLLLIPKDYYWLPGIISDAGVSDISIAVFINLAALLALVVGITSGCALRRTRTTG